MMRNLQDNPGSAPVRLAQKDGPLLSATREPFFVAVGQAYISRARSSEYDARCIRIGELCERLGKFKPPSR